jgi:predicted PurR-regulated permease PerM
VQAWLHSSGARLLPRAESVGRLALHHGMVVLFTILGLFFLYRGGEDLAGRFESLIAMTGPRGKAYLRLAAATLRATLGGMFLVALLDGMFIGAGYAAAGLPSPQV